MISCRLRQLQIGSSIRYTRIVEPEDRFGQVHLRRVIRQGTHGGVAWSLHLTVISELGLARNGANYLRVAQRDFPCGYTSNAAHRAHHLLGCLLTALQIKHSSCTHTMSTPAKPKRRKGVPPTPLKLFQDALGRRNADLMAFMPLEKIDYVEQHDPNCGNFLGHKICLGDITDDKGITQVLWAYMEKVAQKDGLPYVYVLGAQPSGESLSPWSMNVVIEKAGLREEFQSLVFEPGVLSAVIKVNNFPAFLCMSPLKTNRAQACFILKGAELPLDLTFTKGFINKLARASRKCKGGGTANLDPTPSNHGQTSDVDLSSPMSPVRPRPKIRKTQQRGPSEQRYDALSAEPQALSTPSSTPAASDQACLTLINRSRTPANSTDGPGSVPVDPLAKPHLRTPIMSKVRYRCRIWRLESVTDMRTASSWR
jgi:hypothetical protein